MKERITWEDHQDLKLMISDHSNLDEEGFSGLLKLVQEEILKQKKSNSILCLIDTTNTYITDRLRKEAAEMIKVCDGYVKKTAFVGVTGIKRIIINALQRGYYLAKNRDDARQWLLKTP